jgi:UDP-2-acetamido-2,6-beta-L-arabino-hexul-4-ose reductase
VPAGRERFASQPVLDEFVSQCDAIVHFAGMNRGSDEEIQSTNVGLAKDLVAACRRTDCTPHLVFASSIHMSRDTAYGRSKKEAAAQFQNWAQLTGGQFTLMILPHIFGEGGRPFYNSVVSTFCHQLAKGEQPKIDHDGELDLVHAQVVAQRVTNIVQDGVGGEASISGHKLRVSELLTRLQTMDKTYKAGVIPDLDHDLDLLLFNTYRSYLFPEFYPVEITLHQDERGALFEAVKTRHGGQAFLSTTLPGVTRGNHYHYRKIERFLVVRGNAVVRLRKLFSDQVHELSVSGEKVTYIDIPTLHTHKITNVGSTPLLTLFWAHEIFDPETPDTVAQEV